MLSYIRTRAFAAIMLMACLFPCFSALPARCEEKKTYILVPEVVPVEGDDFDVKSALEALLSAGVDARDEYRNSPLMLAARLGDAATLKDLIARGADVSAADRKGANALMYASFLNDMECASALIDAGADVNSQDNDKRSPLMYALLGECRTDFARFLLEKGAYAESRTRDGVSPMMAACRFSKDTDLLGLLYDADAETGIPDRRGDRPLHYAAQNTAGAAAEIIGFLMERRANVDAKNRDGWTPLMFAAQFSEDVSAVNALIEAGANVNARKNDGMTSLMLAACNASPAAADIMKTLFAAGADIGLTDKYGRGVRDVAIRSGHSIGILEYIDGIMPVEMLKAETLTALVEPFAEGVKALVRPSTGDFEPLAETAEHESPAEEIGEEEKTEEEFALFTPLMLAAVNENEVAPEIIRYLLENGEDIEAKDPKGRTPLSCAVRYNAGIATARALIEFGADTKVRVAGNSLSKLSRFNKKLTPEDRRELLLLLKGKAR